MIKDKFNKFMYKIFNQKNKEKVIYFFGNFKYHFLVLLLIILCIRFYFIYKENYSRKNIENYFKSATYVGNAVAINSTDFLTSYSILKNACNNGNGGKRFYLLSKNGGFEVRIKKYDEYKNLAVLTVNSWRLGLNKNYIIFNKSISMDDSIFLSKTNNNLNYKYYRYNVKKDNYLDYIRTSDFLRDYAGEIAINDRLEFAGIVDSEKKSLLFDKKVYIISPSIVKQFLKESGVPFIVNYGNADLRQFNGYIGDVNYKILCRNEYRNEFPPTIIRITR